MDSKASDVDVVPATSSSARADDGRRSAPPDEKTAAEAVVVVVARKARRLPEVPRPSRAADRVHGDDGDDDLLPPPRRMRPLEGVFGGGGDVNAMAADVVVARISAEAVMSPRAIVIVDTKIICDEDGWVAGICSLQTRYR
jgi:hypothetical protein